MPKIIVEDDVFKAVIEVLVTQGYDGATTQEIAAAANIHEATLFRKYGNKVRLIERAVEHQLASTPLSSVSYTGDLQTDLQAIVEAYVATVARHGEIIPTILLEIPRHPELRHTLQAPMANIRGIVNIIARYQREGALKSEPPLTSVNVLLGPIMVNQMFRRANIDLPAPTIDLQEHVAAFLHGRI